MVSDSIQTIEQHLKDILGAQNGYLGHEYTWGEWPHYLQLGVEPTEDFGPMLSGMSVEQRKTLVMIMTYFELHARPLKRLLDDSKANKDPEKYFSTVAWSHFATVIMFGMLEMAVKGKRGLYLKQKGDKIKKFLEYNLSQKTRDNIVLRYSTDRIFRHKKAETFGDVIDHLWYDVRCGFIHDIGLESKGLGSYVLDGTGSREDPIVLKSDVPMPEWLQITWQAILNSFGYQGTLVKRELSSVDGNFGELG